ncbi:hypothetical protein GCM10010492_70480 [Saccharothrix mutabilis subsp. mutabilis]|uniref:Transposase IS4-like domain-containing protein n=1 Tax=Saccharothrix mutabilis subsp. mutabilis TaxID=66855 RepID=A0ABP3EFF7_9PSEU
MTGSNPVDRGKPGSKIHRVIDRNGLPLAIGVSAANLHDSQALKPMLMAIPRISSKRGPRRFRPAKLHADKAYDIDHLRRWLRHRGTIPRIARKGIDFRPPRPTPLGRGADDLMADRLPPSRLTPMRRAGPR